MSSYLRIYFFIVVIMMSVLIAFLIFYHERIFQINAEVGGLLASALRFVKKAESIILIESRM